MGYGVPSAIGGNIATKGKRVICLDVDGSIQMNLQELQTIVHNKCDIHLFVLNNEGYHSMRQTQSNLFEGDLCGVSASNGVSFPDMEKIAYAYGIPYFKITSLDDMEEVIVKSLELTGPVMCEVMLDKAQFFAPKLSSRVLPDGKIVSPEIDDLYPFLERAEYEANKKVEF